jgi:hypothetical protein
MKQLPFSQVHQLLAATVNFTQISNTGLEQWHSLHDSTNAKGRRPAAQGPDLS